MASAPFAAGYPGTCKKCQKRIEVGEMVRWAGKGVVQHDRCSSAWREAQTAPGGPILPLLQPKKESAPEFATQAELDELFALDDALSSVPMVEGRPAEAGGSEGAGGVEGHAAPARTDSRTQTSAGPTQGLPVAGTKPGPAPSLPAAPLETAPTSRAGEGGAQPAAGSGAPPSLIQVVQELRSTVGSLAAIVRVLATATERIAAALPPDKYLVPKDHWTRSVEPTPAGAEMKTGDPL